MARAVSLPDRSKCALRNPPPRNSGNEVNDTGLGMDRNRLPAKLPYRISNLCQGFSREFGVHRKRKHFMAYTFRLRQITGVVSQLAVARLQVNRNRIVNASAHASCMEMRPQLIAPFGEQRKDVINRRAVDRHFKQAQACVRKLTRVGLGMLATRRIPIVEVL